MYNLKLLCTYYFYDVELRKMLPTIEITEEMKNLIDDNDDFADLLYKAELLQVFGLNDIYEMDDSKILIEIELLYEKIKKNSTFEKCILNSANKMMSEDSIFGFMTMFNYHTFFITHRCLCEFFEKGELSLENEQLLLKITE